MQYRQLGRSGLQVPVLSLGTLGFGRPEGTADSWGEIDVARATRMVDMCLDVGVNFFDTADVYSRGGSERLLGEALKGRRDRALISTKATFPMSDEPNDKGSSRYHLIRSCEASLKRLGTDHIDLYIMHGFDGRTPVEETLRALDDLISAGKIVYIGVSNFSGWHLMKSLAASERDGFARYVVYQGYYSLIGRDYEWELMPLGADQGVGLMVWSPLGWGRLTGKLRRGETPATGRIVTDAARGAPPVDDEHLYTMIDALDRIAAETGKSVPQIALNWLLTRPTVCNIVMGARDETQLRANLDAVDWSLSPEHLDLLDRLGRRTPIYPYWHQRGFTAINPTPTIW